MITHNFDKIIKNIAASANDFKPPLKRFYVYMLSQTARTFKRLGKGGQSYRGVSWPWFAPVRIRKKGDVVIVPAVGISGKYKGKLRHSGKRVTTQSRLMQDSGLLRQSALSTFAVRSHELTMDTPLKYAKTQNAMRSFAFVTHKDTDELREYIIEYLLGV